MIICEEANQVRSSATTGQNLLKLEERLQSALRHGTKKGSKNIWLGIRLGIRWKFNPPAAPHFGQLWERLVRSCKKAMYAMLGNKSVTKDVISTTMCLVEQTLSARPLTPVSSDVNDLETLTLNHFLLGNRNLCVPYLPYADNFVHNRNLFRQTQAFANLIWDRFRKEYLPTLNNRPKWRSTANETLKEGDLVWLIKDNDKSECDNLGRVMKTIGGSDGKIPSAIFRTNYGVYKRPVVKRAPILPGRDVFAMENRVGDVAAELTNSVTKLNSLLQIHFKQFNLE